ncbi:hypothetical protein B5F77_12295 [Parabacteroides sp. An277]|nr:hypothetical protein B5F77_12295 [Parabacteroides sp. An277]
MHTKKAAKQSGIMLDGLKAIFIMNTYFSSTAACATLIRYSYSMSYLLCRKQIANSLVNLISLIEFPSNIQTQ